MRKEIMLTTVEVEFIEPQPEPCEGKRWSFSYVYFLEDLRNIYRLYDDFEINSVSALFNKCLEERLPSWNGKAWTERNLLELVNALKNFHLLSLDDHTVSVKGLFSKTQASDPLSEEEKNIFKNIYFSYFRFAEFHRFFVGVTDVNESILLNKSTSLICYIQESRFTNRFLLGMEPETRVFGISDEHADMMRFWDVYLKWGMALGLLKKYPLKPFGFSTVPRVKGLSVVYFCQEMPKDFSVFDYMLSEMQGSYLFIPDILFSILCRKRYSAEDIINRIVEESMERPDTFRAQSTSAIFINDKEAFLFPKMGNTYITHLLKL